MNKTNFPCCMSSSSYAAPKCNILEIKTEGVLCFSLSADKIRLADPLDEFNDYEQIF